MKKRLWILSVLLLFCALVFSSCAVDEGDCAHEFGEWTTVKNATCILVFHEGTIVERGTHEELIAKDGIYARMYRTQTEKEEMTAW